MGPKKIFTPTPKNILVRETINTFLTINTQTMPTNNSPKLKIQTFTKILTAVSTREAQGSQVDQIFGFTGGIFCPLLYCL
jgi:hypothetical protein